MLHNKKGISSTALQPRISYLQAKTAWFLHRGQAYPVTTCATDLFKSAIAGMALGEYAQELLRSSELDLMARWYLLCELKRFPLFESKEKAEQFLLERKG